MVVGRRVPSSATCGGRLPHLALGWNQPLSQWVYRQTQPLQCVLYYTSGSKGLGIARVISAGSMLG